MPSLLDLPGELRNEIYTLVVDKPDVRPSRWAKHSTFGQDQQFTASWLAKWRPIHALMHLNQQVRTEALPYIFGTQRRCEFVNATDFLEYTRDLDPVAADMLREVTVIFEKFEIMEPKGFWASLTELTTAKIYVPNLQALKVQLKLEYMDSARTVVAFLRDPYSKSCSFLRYPMIYEAVVLCKQSDFNDCVWSMTWCFQPGCTEPQVTECVTAKK